MEYEYLLENVSRQDMSVDEAVECAGDGDAVVVMASVGCTCGRGVCRKLRERYNLQERLRMTRANRLEAGEVAVVGCYDDILKKAVTVAVVLTKEDFWRPEEDYMYEGLLSLARVARTYGLRRLFLVCDNLQQSKHAYETAADIFRGKYKKINVVIANKF